MQHRLSRIAVALLLYVLLAYIGAPAYNNLAPAQRGYLILLTLIGLWGVVLWILWTTQGRMAQFDRHLTRLIDTLTRL